VRTITPALAAILRSRFQAAGDGFSGRIEVDSVTPPASSEPIDFTSLFDYGTGGVWFDGNLHTWTTVFGNGDPSVFGFTEPVNLGSFQIYWHYGGLFLHDGSAGPASGAAGSFRLEGGPTSGGPWTTVLEDADPVTTAGASYPGDFDWTYVLDAAATYRYWRLTSTDVGANNDIYELKGFTPDTEGGIVSTSYRPKRINLNRNLRMGPDQASIDLINEALPYGWGPTSIFPTNSRIRCYQWFGDPANEVLTFTGVIDKIGDSRDPLTTSLECRSMAGPILVDQTFSTTAPQGADEDGPSGPRRTASTSTARWTTSPATSSTAPAGRRPTSTSPTRRSSSTSSSSRTARAGGTRSRASWSSSRTTCGTTRTRSSTSSPLGSAAGVDDALTADYEYEIGIA
jgi:hypothetical protein